MDSKDVALTAPILSPDEQGVIVPAAFRTAESGSSGRRC